MEEDFVMKSSIYYEQPPVSFNVNGITTNFYEWLEGNDTEMDRECYIFAKRQKAFMHQPVSAFGNTEYRSKTIHEKTLNDLVLQGPLYRVNKVLLQCTDLDKVERSYVDKTDFSVKKVFVYPEKEIYVIRYGSVRV